MSCDVSLDFLFCLLLFFFFLSKNCALKTGMTGLRCRVLKVHFAKSFHRENFWREIAAVGRVFIVSA